MTDPLGSLVSNVERFVRWIYPGFLLLVLLHLSDSPDWHGNAGGPIETFGLSQLAPSVQVFALVIGAVVSSVIIYEIYRYIFHAIVIQYLFLYLLTGQSDVVTFSGLGQPRNGLWQRPMLRRGLWTPFAFNRWSTELQRAALNQTAEGDRNNSSYRDYSWAITHATGITGLLLAIALFKAEQYSIIDDLRIMFCAILGLLIVVYIWQLVRGQVAGINLANRLRPIASVLPRS